MAVLQDNVTVITYYFFCMEFNTLASKTAVETAIAALQARNVEAEVLATGAQALEKIKALIPQGASVMNGSSRTLEEIGFVEHLKSGTHGWNNLHEAVLKEADPAKQAKLRKESVLSDVYLGSAHAIAETGEMVFASNSGSQLPHLVFTSPTIILVVSTKKITPTLTDAITRVREYVYPLEDKRMKDVGYGGSQISKLLIWEKEPAMMGRKAHVLFVEEDLGF